MKKKDSNAGIKEIAKRANVAIATVDRVIHNRPGVSPKTRDKINAIIKKLNYQPNILARRLASRKILQFAILIPVVSEPDNSIGAQLKGIEAAEAEIRQYGINIHKFYFDPLSSVSFTRKSKELLQKKVDAVLLIPTFKEEAVKFLKSCGENNIPCALMNAEIPGVDGLFYIGPPLKQSGYQAAELMNLGEEKELILIVNIIGETDNEEHLEKKEEGFRSYYAENQLKVDIVKTNIRSADKATISKKLKALLQTDLRVKGIFVTNEKVFMVASLLEKMGRKDIMLIGFDFIKENLEYVKKDFIDFLICHKLQEQGYRAVMALYQKLVFNAEQEKVYFMPIDIVTKENYSYYNN